MFDLTDTKARQSLRHWAEKVADQLRQQSDTSGAAAIDQATAQLTSERFVLAVLGKAKRGKSTLLNALLGRKDDLVAPIDKLPASSAITRFTWAEKDLAAVSFQDGRQEQIAFNRIREYVTEEHNRENVKRVVVVDVQSPFPGLDRDLMLVDTPGAGSLHEHHDALLQAFIPQADAVVFMVTARMPLDQDELELLARVQKADIRKIFFVINRVDEGEQTDIEAATQHNRKLLSQIGIHVDHMHHLSAKLAFMGEREASGIDKLVTDIRGFLRVNKGQVLEARLVSRVAAAAESTLHGLAVRLAGSRKSSEELDAELRQLADSKATIESERGLAERTFRTTWQKATHDFELVLDTACLDVTRAVTGKIDPVRLTDVRSLARELPTFLARMVDETLLPSSRIMEESMRKASQQLDADYPGIALGSLGQFSIRPKANGAVLAGAIGGAALAATGGGIVLAGGAAAASIAAANAAAIAAAVTTVAAPTGLGSALASLAGVTGFGWLAPIATLGTATVAVPAPAVLTATPLWVALTGPVGWTLAGLGALVVPLAWRSSRLKQKEQLEEAALDQVHQIFRRIRSERIPALRRAADQILEDYRLRLDRRLNQLQKALRQARDQRPDSNAVKELESSSRSLEFLLAERIPAIQAVL